MAKTIVVINGAHAGYRRAGLSLAAGRNELDAATVSAAQLEMFKADPKLTTVEADEGVDPSRALVSGGVSDDLITGTLAGVVDQDGQVHDLASMTVPSLKSLAAELKIESYANMKKAELVAAIQATKIQYEVSDDDGKKPVADDHPED